jgi:hypothetical protein
MPIPEQLPEQIHLALEIMMGLKGNQHQISTEEIQLLKIESSTPTYDEVKHAALDVLYETLIFLLSGHAEEQTVDLRQVAVELLKKIADLWWLSWSWSEQRIKRILQKDLSVYVFNVSLPNLGFAEQA